MIQLILDRRLLAAASAVLFSFAAVAAPKNAGNQPPTISGQPATTVSVGSRYAFQPSASDPEGKKIRFSIANKPGWATFANSTGLLSGAPSGSHVGTYSNIRISATDGRNVVSLPSFSITVQAASNRAPTISGSPSASVTAGQSYAFAPSASDADGDSLGFSIQNRPVWATFSTSTGRLSGAPTLSQAGSYANIIISVSDGKASTALPAFTITVDAPANAAPVIGGSPAASVNAGSTYVFRPTASDANGDPLTFSIANRPSWANFDPATGQLSGTPTGVHVGQYSNIVISVSDGLATASLAPFAITVTQIATGSATLSWTPPTQNTDGSALTNLAGYRILYGVSSSSLTQTVEIPNPGATSYVIENLAPATYYFAVKAYTSAGAESASSNLASKVVQ